MKPLASVRSAERSSRANRRRPTRNRHNLLPKKKKKKKKKNRPVEVVPKVHLVGLKVPPADQAGHLGRSADLLVGLRGLPVDQAGHLEGVAEDDGQRKA
jgi:hypothetical protein